MRRPHVESTLWCINLVMPLLCDCVDVKFFNVTMVSFYMVTLWCSISQYRSCRHCDASISWCIDLVMYRPCDASTLWWIDLVLVMRQTRLNFINSALGVNVKKLEPFCWFSKMLLFIKRPRFLKLMSSTELVKLSLRGVLSSWFCRLHVCPTIVFCYILNVI